MVAPGEQSESTKEREWHATNLELFLDLVFVFAVTQITSLVAHEVSWRGVGRGALIAWLVWWQWSQYTWAGSAVDLQRDYATRLLVLCTVPVTLVMAISLPNAYHADEPWFGVAYVLVQLLVLGMQGLRALRSAGTRGPFLRYASAASITPVCVLIGSLLYGDLRVALWCIAVVIGIVGAFGAKGEWVVNPVHFAERHALFVIIALGEALVAVGATASALGLTASILLGICVAVTGACVVWWAYFAFIPGVAEHTLRKADPVKRAQLARDLFTFGHFPIIAGIMCYAVVAKHVVPHATHATTATDRALLAAAVALIVGAFSFNQFQVVRRVNGERVLAIPIVGAWCALAGDLPGYIVLGVAVIVLGAMAAISWRRFLARGVR